jgi:hypothetical protein
MLTAIKNSFKGIGESVVESLARPPIQKEATQQVNEFKTKGLANLSDDLEQFILKAAEKAAGPTEVDALEGNKKPKMTMSSAFFIRKFLLDHDKNRSKLDKFLDEFVKDITPAIHEVLNGVDVEITDYSMNELKYALHIKDEPPEEPLVTTIEQWPVIEKCPDNAALIDQIGFKVHLKLRSLMKRLLPKILTIMPQVLMTCTEHQLRESKEDDFASGVDFFDKMVNSVKESFESVKLKMAKEFVAMLWDGMDEMVAKQLMALMVSLELDLVKTTKEQVAVLPGI